MKNIKAFAIVILLMILMKDLSQAQVKISFDNVKYDFGIKQGINIPYIPNYATIDEKQQDRSGFHFGAYASLRAGNVAIQPEIIFSRQQHVYSFETWDPLALYHFRVLEFTTNFDYINVPIMFKYYLNSRFNIQAGPQLSWLVNGARTMAVFKDGIVQNNADTGGPLMQKTSDFIRSSDIAVAMGVGWDLPCGISLTARYAIGATDMNKQSGVNSPEFQSPFGTTEAKNHVLQLSFGYRLFKFGK